MSGLLIPPFYAAGTESIKMRPSITTIVCTTLTSMSFCLALTPKSLAQNALGTGRALDANTGVGTGGRNVQAPGIDYRARNLLVTGNVVGGRGFRGTVGYRAVGDFAGALGSNDLYAFRANSALSSVSIVNSGGTFDRLRFGQYMGLIEYRREGFSSNLNSVLSTDIFPRSMGIDNRIRLDQYAADTAMHSLIESGVQPDVVGVLRDNDGRALAASVSSVRGMHLQPARSAYKSSGLTSFDMARLRDDIASGKEVGVIGEPFDPRITEFFASDLRLNPGLRETRIDALSHNNRVEPIVYGDYRNIMERIAERFSDRKNKGMGINKEVLQELEKSLQKLRQQPDQPLPSGESSDESEAGTEDMGIFNKDSLSKISSALRHGERVAKLTNEQENRFNELVAQAEQQLREGEYFWAERQFRRALRFTPGHPLATAGLANAQLGAGLYVPAALTLRTLMTNSPEMIDVRYEDGILPNTVRLNSAIVSLRNRFTEKRDRNLIAMLFAYIGHQINNKEMVQQGLAIMTETIPDDKLLVLLKSVWLADEDSTKPDK